MEKTFRELTESVRLLRDQFQSLQLTIREDLPAEGGVVLVDKFGDAVDDVLGWLAPSAEAMHGLQRPLNGPADLEFAKARLKAVQEDFYRAQHSFQWELVSYEWLRDLTTFGRSRGGEWLLWVDTVKAGLENCRSPLEECGKTLIACWQEIAEHRARSLMSVYVSSIGQQVMAPAATHQDQE